MEFEGIVLAGRVGEENAGADIAKAMVSVGHKLAMMLVPT